MELSPAFSNIFWIERHVLSLTARIIWFLIIRSRTKLPMSLQLRMETGFLNNPRKEVREI